MLAQASRPCLAVSCISRLAHQPRGLSARLPPAQADRGRSHLSSAKTVIAATILGATLAGLEAWLPQSTHASESLDSLAQSLRTPISDLSNEAPFWENLLRYVQYFFSIMLGTVYVMLKPFAQLLRNPLTGILVIGGTVGLVYGVKVTVQAMLGVEDLFEYQASSIVTPIG